MQTQLPQRIRNSKLKDFLVDQLQDIYWAEKKLAKKLHKLSDGAKSTALKKALNDHAAEKRIHVERLEKVFGMMGEDAEGKKCPAMSRIIEEGEDIIDDTDDGSMQRDVGIIFAAQKAFHYEMATYGGLAQLAKTLGYTEAKSLLAQTLEEEKTADELLTEIAENGINYEAAKELEYNKP